MKTFVAISALAALASALPRGRREAPSLSLLPGGPLVPPGSFTGFPTGTGFPFPTGSGFPFPTGSGYPFPTGSGFAMPTGEGYAFKSGGFGHHHHGTGYPFPSGFGGAPTGFMPSGAVPIPTGGPFVSARNAQLGSGAASFTEPIESGSALPTAAPSISFPASGFGGASGFAAPTGSGGAFSFSGFGGESGSAQPTGLGGESGGALPSGLGGGSFPIPSKSGSGFALPTGFVDKLEHHRHFPTGSGFALPTGSFTGFPTGFPTGSFTGLPSGSFSFPAPTGTGTF